MNLRMRFMAAFFGICFAGVMVMFVSIWFTPRYPLLSWLPLAAWAAMFAGVFWLFRHYRGRLPPPTPNQRAKAIRSHRRMAWIYLGGLVLGLIANGREILTLPHRLGFILPLIPIGLAAIHLRVAAQLSQKAIETGSQAIQ
jgi:hypothetical protein